MRNVGRLLATAVLLAAVARLGWLYAAIEQPDHRPFSDDAWLQPDTKPAHHVDPISAQRWPFDFAVIETDVARFLAHAANTPRPDETLARLFEQIVLDLPDDLDENSVERIGLLLQKSFPGAQGETLAALFPPLFRYRQALAAETDALQTTTAVDTLQFAQASLRAAQRLQVEHLGPTLATQLYANQNALTDYLLQRRQIREDATLSAEQQELALRALTPPRVSP